MTYVSVCIFTHVLLTLYGCLFVGEMVFFTHVLLTLYGCLFVGEEGGHSQGGHMWHGQQVVLIIMEQEGEVGLNQQLIRR
jgi:hypothetical protein